LQISAGAEPGAHRIVLLVLNSESNAGTCTVNAKGQSFIYTYTLPAGALATFEWK
jgi:hypothetical protein